ncbi:MAG: lipopolysaccharide heptosyltransferase I [Burkholderiales bacterium]|nr:lipopolysaccharide heptosyltransferase I [Burkholderiales bacterium]
MKILIVKLSSLGDVVHAMPAVQDIVREVSGAEVHWVVERAFAPLVECCHGVQCVVQSDLRRWRKALLSPKTRAEWVAFRETLREDEYGAIIDLQGLAKSALVSRVAQLAPGGLRFAMANPTEGSSYEVPTRWAADVAVPIEPRIHAVARSREMCARSLGYDIPAELRYGLVPSDGRFADKTDCVALIHGTSRPDKLWPEKHWVELGRKLVAQGYSIGLPHGNEVELDRSERIAGALGPRAEVWPRWPLDTLFNRLAACAGAIGVDSGLSHIAVALDLPHVQIYNFDTAWRTGPVGNPRQGAVYESPTPSLDSVWDAWLRATVPG